MRSEDTIYAQRLLDGNDPAQPFTVDFSDGTEMRSITEALLLLGCKVSNPSAGLQVLVTPPGMRAKLQPSKNPEVRIVQLRDRPTGDEHTS